MIKSNTEKFPTFNFELVSTPENYRSLIVQVHNQMKHLTVRVAKVDKHKYESILIGLEGAELEELETLLLWLKNYFLNEFKELWGIRILLDEEIWDRYQLFNTTGLREIDLLKAACRKVRNYWNKYKKTHRQRMITRRLGKTNFKEI